MILYKFNHTKTMKGIHTLLVYFQQIRTFQSLINKKMIHKYKNFSEHNIFFFKKKS